MITMGLNHDAKRFLDELREVLPGFEDRLTQRRFLEIWSHAIDNGESIAIEAPTGSGKSFAYTIPAVLSGQKTVIATRTINLQHQLIEKDLPTLARVREFEFALGKGFSNFACRLKAEAQAEELPLNPAMIEALETWLAGTESGEVEHCYAVLQGQLPRAEVVRAWKEITASSDDCLRRRCRYHPERSGGCFYFAHRARWASAHVLVVNHHLLLYDLLMKASGQDLLPPAELLVIDEAHELEASALHVFTQSARRGGFWRLCRQLARHGRSGRPGGLLADDPDAFKRITDLMPEAEGRWGEIVEEVRRWPEFRAKGENAAIRLTGVQLKSLSTSLLGLADVANEAQRTSQAHARGAKLLDKHLNVIPEDGAQARLAMRFRRVILGLERYAGTICHLLDQKADDPEDPHVRWFELARGRPAVCVAPLYPGARLMEHLAQHYNSALFTSATLSTRRPEHDRVGEGFELFRRLTGFGGSCVQLPEVFDYSRSKLHLHPHSPPSDGIRNRAYLEAIADAIEEIIARPGRHLVLFTSVGDLAAVCERLRESAPDDCEILIQEEGRSRMELARSFREIEWGTLLGLDSFWRGFDAPGMASVTLVRLPFEVPNDPITQARIEDLKGRELNPFSAYVLPRAVIAFRQGVGRLIRRADDRGEIHVLDGRVLEKRYGKTFLQALPEIPLQRTSE